MREEQGAQLGVLGLGERAKRERPVDRAARLGGLHQAATEDPQPIRALGRRRRADRRERAHDRALELRPGVAGDAAQLATPGCDELYRGQREAVYVELFVCEPPSVCVPSVFHGEPSFTDAREGEP